MPASDARASAEGEGHYQYHCHCDVKVNLFIVITKQMHGHTIFSVTKVGYGPMIIS